MKDKYSGPGRPKKLPDHVQYMLNLPLEMRDTLEDYAWQNRMSLADYIREILQEAINRKKGEGSRTPFTNIEYGQTDKFNDPAHLSLEYLQSRFDSANTEEDVDAICNAALVYLRKAANITHEREHRKFSLRKQKEKELKRAKELKDLGLMANDMEIED